MKNIKKVIFEYLPLEDRIRLENDLHILKTANNTKYIIVASVVEFLERLDEINIEEQFVLQIIAHGDYDGFGIPEIGIVYYSQVAESLRRINSMTKNKLILNLMTVCKSSFQLSLFNQSSDKLFQTMIGSVKNSGIHGSVQQSIHLNDLELANVAGRIEMINENADSDYIEGNPEKCLYWITN